MYSTSLDNYIIFNEVAKVKNLTKASENLFISQPAVSQAIKKLEDNLGIKLFIRSKRGMELTDIGKKIYEKSSFGLFSFNAIEELVQEEKGLLTGELNIGSGATMMRKSIMNELVTFMNDYPSVKINIHNLVQENKIHKLHTGELQFIITQFSDEINFPFIPLFDMRYVFVSSVKNKSNRYITHHKGSFARDILDKYLFDNATKNVSLFEISGYKNALDLVSMGAGITVVPDFVIEEYENKQNLTILNTDYNSPVIKVGIYYNPELSTPACKMFIKYIKKKF